MDKLDVLKSLGFTEYEARAYLALADLGASTAREVADYSRLPRNKTYEMLSRLERQKRIVSLPVSPRKYRIMDAAQLKDEVSTKKKELALLEKGVFELIESSRNPRAEFKEIFWVIRGKQAIMQKMVSANEQCRSEILSLNRLSVASPKNLRTISRAIGRGVKVRFLAPFSKSNMANIKKWKSIGAQVKNYDETRFGPIGTRLSVFDKESVRITFGEPDVSRPEDYITLWAESPYLANMIRNYFLSIWARS